MIGGADVALLSGSVKFTSLTFNWNAVSSKLPPVLPPELAPELAPELTLELGPELEPVPLEFSVVPWISSAENRMEISSIWMSPAGTLAVDAVLPAAGALAEEVEAGVDAAVVPEAAALEAAVEAAFEAGAEALCDGWDSCCARFWNTLTRSAKAVGEMDWMRLAT